MPQGNAAHWVCVIPTLNITHCPQEAKTPTWALQRAEKKLHENAMI